MRIESIYLNTVIFNTADNTIIRYQNNETIHNENVNTNYIHDRHI